MKNFIKAIIVVLILSITFVSQTNATIIDTSKDSTELQIHDMLMLFLSDPIRQAVDEYYLKFLTQSPTVYPYEIFIQKTERVNHFRGFHFKLTLDVSPVVGPHISVGKDRLVFEISPTIPDQIKLVDYQHLESHDLPPHWQHIIKKP